MQNQPSHPDATYFDAVTITGPRPGNRPEAPWRLEELEGELNHAGISRALVWSTRSILYDPMRENRRLSAELAEIPALFAGWNLLPAGTGESPSLPELIREIKSQGVRAVSVHPKSNGWNLLGRNAVRLFRAISEAGLPCFMARAEAASWTELEAFLDLNPELKLVLHGIHWVEQRQIIPLLHDAPGLHLTMDTLQMNRGYEDLVSWGLQDRILFGSRSPTMSAGAQRTGLDYADITQDAREAIASRNLERLLGLPHSTSAIPASDDPLIAAARCGEPLPCRVLDLHMHILDEGLNGAGGSHRMSRGGPTGVFDQLGRLGVSGGGFMSWNGPVSGDSVGGNHCVAAALDAAPPGFWGLATFDPCNYSQAELSRMIPAWYESDPRFIGMKPYFSHRIEYHDKRYDVWWNVGNELGLYAGIHRVRNDFAEVDALAAKYPNVKWVIFHCGSDFATAEGAAECVQRHPNVFAEITFTSVGTGVIEFLAEYAGADRVLYGSDLPMRDPAPQLGWIVYSRLPLETRTRILGQNAAAALAPLFPAPPEPESALMHFDSDQP